MNKLSETHLSSPAPQWNYVGWASHPAPPGGVKLQLLTKGGVTVLGTWSDNAGFIAWAPLLQRNKALEEAMAQGKTAFEGGMLRRRYDEVN